MLDAAWLPFNRTPPAIVSARTRLLCLPFAGGGASTYAGWIRLQPATVEVLPVQLPGREHRIGEPPYREMDALLDRLMETLIDPIAGEVALFGHSMGALVAAELARRMADSGRPPLRLLVSGFPPPHHARAQTALHRLPREAMLRELAKLNGLRPEVLASPELVDLILPTLYADLRLEETHAPTPLAPLPCPVSVFAADGDPIMPGASVEAWREATSRECIIHRFHGDHFYLLARLPEVLALIEQDLEAARAAG